MSIQQRLHTIRTKISEAEKKYQRQPGAVQLLAVSKTRPAEDIRQAYDTGQSAFGENYVQEALQKIQQLADLDIDWHYIGPIQSNKTREITQHFSWVHSVDRLKIAQRLNDQRPPEMPPLSVCIQVNIDNEESKSGVKANEVLKLAEQILALPNLKLRGLMAIPTATNDFETQRRTFARVRKLAEELRKQGIDIDTLSMGMTNDLEAAIAEGATIVRIGTAIFGPRLAKQTTG